MVSNGQALLGAGTATDAVVPVGMCNGRVFRLPSSRGGGGPPVDNPRVRPGPLGSYTEFGQLTTISHSPGSIVWKLTTISGGAGPRTVAGERGEGG